jgi:hypothetical protein
VTDVATTESAKAGAAAFSKDRPKVGRVGAIAKEGLSDRADGWPVPLELLRQAAK